MGISCCKSNNNVNILVDVCDVIVEKDDISDIAGVNDNDTINIINNSVLVPRVVAS